MTSKTSQRKADHIKICLEKDVEFEKANGFGRIELEHSALPEMSLDDIDTSTSFLGKGFKAPIFIEAMTGGSEESARINRNLAEAAERMGIGMGVGSQRAMLENPGLAGTYSVRDIAPSIFILGNIGAAQLARCKEGDLERLVESIGADGLAIHLNPAQELAQDEGDRDWKDVLGKIRGIAEAADFPVIVKEVGCGISGRVARQLEGAGVSAIDVAGAGGTSWVKVDSLRSSRKASRFSEWGIPTAEALMQCARETKVPLIASGGIRNGLEVAKAIAMGASLAGLALPLLKPASESGDAVAKKLEEIVNELRMAMFLVGARNIRELSKVKYYLTE